MARIRSRPSSLSKILATTSSPLYVVDEQRFITFCNEACEAWTGMLAEQLVGLQCSFHSAEQVEPLSMIANALCPPPDVFLGRRTEGSVELVRSNGELERRAVEFIPLNGSGPTEPIGVLVVVGAAMPSEQNSSQPSSFNAHEQLRRLRATQRVRYRIERFVGESPASQRIRAQMQLAVEGRPRTVIVGPPGSGRERAARTIHSGRVSSREGLLLPLACSKLDAETLLTSVEAFLRRPRSSPDELPGTLLLLDVDALSLDTQLVIWRLLNGSRFYIPTLATSRRSLISLSAERTFRPDLSAALSTLEIEVPALTSRPEDLSLLVQAFVEEHNATGTRQLSGMTTDALQILATYPWPGNVDELATVIQEICSRTDGPWIQPTDLPSHFHIAAGDAKHASTVEPPIVLDEFLLDVEKELIQRALRRTKGNKAKAARLLGTTRPRILRRLQQFKLD